MDNLRKFRIIDETTANPLFFIILELLKNDNITKVIIYGGKSSAKTVSVCQALGLEADAKGKSSVLYRKQSNLIKRTLKKSMNVALASFALEPEDLKFEYRFDNKAEISLTGVDTPEKVKGLESYSYLLFDELNHFDWEEYSQADISLRGTKGQKLFGTLNPVDENIWVKKKIIDTQEWVHYETETKLPCSRSFVKINTAGDTILIKTTYEDNYWSVGSPCGTYGFKDEGLISKYNALRLNDPEQYAVNVLGEWGTIKPENPFFRNVDNIKKVETHIFYDIPLLFSFDFNYSPTTVSICQQRLNTKEDSGIHMHASIEKDGGTEILVKELIDLGWAKHPDIRITGDYNGNSASSTAGKSEVGQAHNDYRIIQKMLNLTDFQMSGTKTINPRILLSRVLCNTIIQHIPLFFDKDNCAELLADIKKAYVVTDAAGKEKLFKDRNKGYGLDHFDNFRYAMNYFFKGDVDGVIKYSDMIGVLR